MRLSILLRPCATFVLCHAHIAWSTQNIAEPTDGRGLPALLPHMRQTHLYVSDVIHQPFVLRLMISQVGAIGYLPANTRAPRKRRRTAEHVARSPRWRPRPQAPRAGGAAPCLSMSDSRSRSCRHAGAPAVGNGGRYNGAAGNPALPRRITCQPDKGYCCELEDEPSVLSPLPLSAPSVLSVCSPDS